MNKQEIVKSIENLERSIESNKAYTKIHKKSIESNKAHNKEHKKEIKELKVKLEELLLNGWRKSSNTSYSSLLSFFKNGKVVYGFKAYNGGWFVSSPSFASKEYDIPATDKEVEEALIKEAKKFVGKSVVSISNLKTELLNESMVINVFFDSRGTSVWFQEPHVKGVCVMKDGQWATIIKDKTVTLNGDYTKVQLTDLINNRF